MIRRLSGLIVLATVLLSATGQAIAASQSNLPTPQVIELARDPESTVILPSIQVTKYPDGRVSVHGSGRHKISEGGIHYKIEINLEKNTYKAVALPIFDESVDVDPIISTMSDASVTASGSYYITVQLVTEDPLQIDLAQTSTYLSWSEKSDGTLTGASGSKACWAANPSTVGTHWYTTSCTGQEWDRTIPTETDTLLTMPVAHILTGT